MVTESNCAIGFVGTIVGILVAILLFDLVCFEIYFNFADSILYCDNLRIPIYLIGCYVITGELGSFIG